MSLLPSSPVEVGRGIVVAMIHGNRVHVGLIVIYWSDRSHTEWAETVVSVVLRVTVGRAVDHGQIV